MSLTDSTEESRRLCERIAAESGGVCLLGFSRGKDSIAAWLHLRRYFKTIVPFHISSVPGLGFVDRSLEYYEDFFKTKILRYISGGIVDSLNAYLYQTPDAIGDIEELDAWPYDNSDVVRRVRQDTGLKGAWCAWGINASDSLDRRVYVTQYKGRLPRKRSFYPNWDWKRDRIMEWIKAAGVKLPGDYLLANRTLSGLPLYRALARMEEFFPDDLKRIEEAFPLIRAVLAQAEFRRRHLEAKGAEVEVAEA